MVSVVEGKESVISNTKVASTGTSGVLYSSPSAFIPAPPLPATTAIGTGAASTSTPVTYSHSIEVLVEQFRLDCADRNMTYDTIRMYLSSLRIFLDFLNENNVTPFAVDNDTLISFIRDRRTRGGRDNRGAAQKTIENNFAALSSFYEFTVFKGYILRNPIPPIRKRYLVRYKEERSDDSPRRAISVEEMTMLINSVLNRRDKAIMLVLAKTGVRRGELTKMDIQDIDWEEGSITIKRKKFKKRTGNVVFFDDECARALKAWLKVRNTIRSSDKDEAPSQALFLNERGGRLDRNGIYSMVTKYAQRVGLHDPASDDPMHHFSPHYFRHWFTTTLRKAGMDREFIKALRGDRRKEAIDIYDHIESEELRKAYLAHMPQLGV